MKFINAVFFCLFFCVSSVFAADETADLRKYVDNLISEGYKIVQDKSLSESEKFNRSGKLIQANLHLDWMAKYSLGRNVKSLAPEKVKEFTDIYSRFVVFAYADLVTGYKGEKAVIKRVNKINDKMFMVNMEIVKPDSGSPLKVDYLIHKIANSTQPYKVADIITEGVSTLNSQQAEFNGIISSKGIDALIADLKKKSAARG